MTHTLVILGAVGNCLDILDAVLAMNASEGKTLFEIRCFLDDDVSLQGRSFHGVPVSGPMQLAKKMTDVLFINGIGSPRSYRAKESLIERLGLDKKQFATIIHPQACVSPTAVIGHGSVIMANCSICADVCIGDHVMMLPNCVVGHDTSIGDFSLLAAGVVISGRVTIGRSCYLGAGSLVRDGIRIGDEALLGMGSVLLGDVQTRMVMIGNPAKPKREL